MHFTDENELYKLSKRYLLSQDLINKLKKLQISLVNPYKNSGFSRLGGQPLLPQDFQTPLDNIFLGQFDLLELSKYYPGEIQATNFPKTGLLSVFIKSPDNEFYEDAFLHEPSVKLFYFEDTSKLTQSKNSDISKLSSRFQDQFISFEKTFSLPEVDFNPEFKISNELKDLYEIFEYDMNMKLKKKSISNFFGWSTNRQPLNKDDYEKVQNFYKSKSDVIHLFTLTNDFNLDIEEVGFESISVFILEEDLIRGIFDRPWMVPCFD